MTTYDTPVRTVQIPTWTRSTVMKVWAAAAIPMGDTRLGRRPVAGSHLLGARRPASSIDPDPRGRADLAVRPGSHRGTARTRISALAGAQEGAVAQRSHQPPHRKAQQPPVVDDHSADGAAGPRRGVAGTADTGHSRRQLQQRFERGASVRQRTGPNTPWFARLPQRSPAATNRGSIFVTAPFWRFSIRYRRQLRGRHSSGRSLFRLRWAGGD